MVCPDIQENNEAWKDARENANHVRISSRSTQISNIFSVISFGIPPQTAPKKKQKITKREGAWHVRPN